MQSHKIVLLSFNKIVEEPGIVNFEQVFHYSVLGKLALFTNLVFKDLANTTEPRIIPAHLPYDEQRAILANIAQEYRTRFVLTGSITPDQYDNGELSEIRLALRLYDAMEERVVADSVMATTKFAPGKNRPDNVRIQMDAFNNLVDWAVFELIDGILPHTAADHREAIRNYQISTSYEALQLIVAADQLENVNEEIRKYEEAVALDPDLEIAYYHLGKLYKVVQNYRQSVHYFRKALEISRSPQNLKALYATEAGVCCALLGHQEPAIQWWETAIKLAPKYLNAHINIAMSYEELQDFGKAEAYFLSAQKLAPRDSRICYSLARIYSKMGEWDKAIQQYQTNLTVDENDPWCHSDLATCYLQKGDDRNAKVHLEKSAQLDPEGEAGQYAQLVLMQLEIV